MEYNLNINNRAFKAIINKTKRIEIRTNTNGMDYSKLNELDTINFTNDNNETITCLVHDINHYQTVEELLTLEGTRYSTSSTNDFNEAVKSINSLTGYKEAIKKYGIYAIHIEYLHKL